MNINKQEPTPEAKKLIEQKIDTILESVPFGAIKIAVREMLLEDTLSRWQEFVPDFASPE